MTHYVREILPALANSPESRLFQRTLADFLDDALPYERVRELDDEGSFPRDVWQGLADLGALGIGIPEHYGGSGTGGSMLPALLTIVEVSERLPSLGAQYVLYAMVARLLLDHGSEAQREHWLSSLVDGSEICVSFGLSEPDGGTDLLALRSRATRAPGGWIVSGQKLWTTLAAESSIIFALVRTAEPVDGHRARGLSIIAVPTDQDGVTIRRLRLAAMRAAVTCEVVFEGAFAPAEHLVGKEGQGFYMLRPTLAIERILTAGISLGIAQKALELGVEYAGARRAFGRSIGAFQAVQHPLSRAASDVTTALLLVSHALKVYEQGDDATLLASMATRHAAEVAASVVDTGMRVMAAMGLSTETPMQMLFRDARFQLFSPVTNEMILNKIGEGLGLERSY